VALGNWVKAAAAKAASKIEETAKAAAEAAAKSRQAAAERAASEAAAAKLQAEIVRRSAERIPESIFPRHPPYVAEYFDNADVFREDRRDYWELILSWGEPPKNDIERQQREDKLWEIFCDQHTITGSNGARHLRPKQDIIDSWFKWEKWFFRYYYAATGIVHQTIYGHEFLQNFAIKYKYKDVKSWNTQSANEVAAMNAKEKSKDYLDNFLHNVMPQHKEKWGNWFFSM
jgi:hypothetical protein